ncbi:hypothetical protein MPSI1_001973 [Malassezia psittaci]|uniref:Pet127-domain-containing protein n=1 Tax=Malassezia psittaci TaxID=1821823 RepID=A0AAF0FEQ4_9BASI|nr:hypothetical protein MPSI1_001973 [Malassezia psittaci]
MASKDLNHHTTESASTQGSPESLIGKGASGPLARTSTTTPRMVAKSTPVAPAASDASTDPGNKSDPAQASGASTSSSPDPSKVVTFSRPFARRQARPTSFLRGNDADRARIVRLEEYKGGKGQDGERAGRLKASDVRIESVPGVHWLRDKESGRYNYQEGLQNVLDVDLFDFDALPPYLTSSKDPELLAITKKHHKRFCGSTSSMTGLLSQCYFLISRWKEPELKGFSEGFGEMPTGFSEGAKLPISVRLRRQPDGFYAIDADKGTDEAIDNSNYVLTSLGKSLEKYLTVPPNEFALYERINSHNLPSSAREQQEAYHYAKSSQFMMRSQLDCSDERLPRKTFDLKTRACISIRQDRANYAESAGYQISQADGIYQSFEREYWDMVRAAFLKYNFQVRIGNMDGIFVAYHNTSQIFGFQYIKLEEMSQRLFGSPQMGDLAYRLCLGLLEKVLDTAVETFPKQSLSLTLETRSGANVMNVYVQSEDQQRIMQFDVSMDRYLNDALVRGPVDAAGLQSVSESSSREPHAKSHTTQPGQRSLSWYVDYCILPRRDLSAAQMRKNLQEVRQRQNAMQSMVVPNVEKLNQLEKYRIDTLAKRPEALKRFLEERENGKAIGMPLAPGQLSTRQIMEREQMALARTVPKPRRIPEQHEVRWQRIPDASIKKLRELSRMGKSKSSDSDTPTVHSNQCE